MRTIQATLMMSLVAGLMAVSLVQNPASAQDGVTQKVLVTNLDNPSGIAIHEGGDVFVTSRYGVYRYDPKGKAVHLEILNDSFNTTDIYGKGPKYNIGPLGVAFMDKDHLVVGDGSRKDGEELVRVYKIGVEDKEHQPYKEGSAAFTLGPIKAGEQSVKGEGNFYGVAVGAGGIFITCNGDDTKGWISKAEIKDGKPGELKPFITTKVSTEVDAPAGITFSLDGKQLVVSQMGEMNVPGDSLLTIYDPATGKISKKYKTGLSDIAGVAYSAKTKKLYAVDFSWSDTTKGGLFELVVAGDAVKATKVLALDKPTALAFDKEGKLYVTLFGTAKKDADPEKSPGQLIVIPAGL